MLHLNRIGLWPHFLTSCNLNYYLKTTSRDCLGSPVVKSPPSNAGAADLIPGWDGRARIPHALGPKNQNIKQKQYCSKFNRNFKNGPHQRKILKKNKTLSPDTVTLEVRASTYKSGGIQFIP